MRTLGIICVALGITLLVFSVFPIVLAENSTHLFIGLGCAAFLALPLIVTGIVLTRRAAAHAGPEGEAAASVAFLRKATEVLGALSDRDGPPPGGKVDPHGNPMERFRAFDLNSVTLAGWLLVLTSFGFLLGAVLLGNRLVLRDRKEDLGPLGALPYLGGFLLAIAFFYGGRLLLRAFGVPLSKGINPLSDIPQQLGQDAERVAAPDRPRE